jgi:hypothetical protein
MKQIGEGIRVGIGRETGRPETIGLAQPPADESKPLRLKITRMIDRLPRTGACSEVSRACPPISPIEKDGLIPTTGTVQAILDGRQPDGMTLPWLMERFLLEWKQQHHSTQGDSG